MKHTLFFIIVYFLGSFAYAGGPYSVDDIGETGAAQQWGNSTLTWYSESGALSNSVSNEKALGWINDALALWTQATLQDADGARISTANVSSSYLGSVGVDIDDTNYGDYNNTSAGPTVIVFDKDGKITQDLAGSNYRFIPGLTQILLSNSNGTIILKGITIFNGILLDDGTLTEDEFKGVIVHELGHLLNLDHTQVNLDIADACDLGGTCANEQYIPTMFPELKTYRQGTELKIDDKVTLSWIYPASTLENSFCMITGEVQDRDGRSLQGVNVIARRVNDGDSLTRDDARSMVSGAMYSACYNDGHYYLYGIVPGKTYEVIYEPLSSSYTGMSGFEPLTSPPSGFDSGVINSSNGSSTVSCASSGQTIEMQAVQIQVDNPCPATDGDDGSNSSGSGGGCSLIP